MKMKHKDTLALATVLQLAAALPFSTNAQPNKMLVATPPPQLLLNNAVQDGNALETLSGINLYHIGKGAYQLDFSQKLKENAVLSIKNTAQQVVYQKPVSVKNNASSWRYKLGKLKAGTYLVEVMTSDTTYWTKFKIGR